MDPRSFLTVECASVESALTDTLRHDYGPERSKLYFEECKVRLSLVEQALNDEPEMDRQTIATHMRTLSALGSRISLIERSHLGEFSWPFAAIIEHIAGLLFVETSNDEDMQPVLMKPIVHVVAEGTDYQIVDDEVPSPGDRRIIIVAFPRQLKQQVLIHAIFGHELAHVAINAEKPGLVMASTVIPKAQVGPLQDKEQALSWLRRADAPEWIRRAASADGYAFREQWLVNWRQEIICDLFGLRLFGPAFAAAHRTIIESLCPRKDHFEMESATHPPYPIRQKVLATAIQVLGWDVPVSEASDGCVHQGETALIDYVREAVSDPWFAIFDHNQIRCLLDSITMVLEPYSLAYAPPDRRIFCELVSRLGHERPPIAQSIDDSGVPTNQQVSGEHCLYAGWSYWFGRSAVTEHVRQHDPNVRELSFLELNRLCDQALLQQRAIDLVNQSKRKASSEGAR